MRKWTPDTLTKATTILTQLAMRRPFDLLVLIIRFMEGISIKSSLGKVRIAEAKKLLDSWKYPIHDRYFLTRKLDGFEGFSDPTRNKLTLSHIVTVGDLALFSKMELAEEGFPKNSINEIERFLNFHDLPLKAR